MKEAGGIVAVSVPFTAGMAMASIIGPSAFFSSIFLLLCPPAAVLALHGKGGRRPAVYALYLFLGAFCFSSSGLIASVSTEIRLSIDWLTEIVDGMNFGHGSTNALLKALLTGQRTELGKDTVAVFRKSGASHILALSGLHLGVLYGIISKTLSVFGNSRASVTMRSVLTIILSGIYMLMTGAGPSIVRAFIFICIREILRLNPGRKLSPLGILCLALTIQLALNPQVMLSIGFQLSYLAMLGIFTIFPVLKEWYPHTGTSEKWDIMKKIWDAAALTISCQIFTGPLAWMTFRTFPKHFLLTNLLAMPLTEALIVSAVIGVILSACGVCPSVLVRLTDNLAQTMLHCLKIISGL